MSAAGPRLAGLILAGGASRRMGRPKALLEWGGKPLLQHQINELTAAGCDPLVVIVAAPAAKIRAGVRCAPPCRWVENVETEGGRASSVRLGAAQLAEALGEVGGAVVVVNVDQPCRAETVRRLEAAWRSGGAAIVAPRYEGRSGHPVLFSGALGEELRAVEEASQGLRALRERHRERTALVAVDDPLVVVDLNTPAEYEAARRRYLGGEAEGEDAAR